MGELGKFSGNTTSDFPPFLPPPPPLAMKYDRFLTCVRQNKNSSLILNIFKTKLNSPPPPPSPAGAGKGSRDEKEKTFVHL